MRVSFNQADSPRVKDTNGYGYAAKLCKDSLRELGHEVTWRDPNADIEMNFIQPDHWYWTGPYRIGYVPWESTEFLPGWVKKMNNECDELWTPSPVIAQWMVDAGVKKNVHVYQHGVESIWTPVRREPTEQLRLLHHGAEALRKGGRESVEAFLRVLGGTGSTLTMKMLLERFSVPDFLPVKVNSGKIPLDELVGLYHKSDLFIYPSWGEGFGLTPLQAMATGMPVLITQGWAPYEYLLPDSMLVKSTMVDSPWPQIHPGKMFQPDLNDLCDKLAHLYENRALYTSFSYDLAPVVRKDYDWLTLTEEAFSHLF